MTCQHQSLSSFAFQKAWIGGQESAFKKDKKVALGTEGNTVFFLCYQPNCHKNFTFTKIRCSFQLICILTFPVRRSLRSTNFVVCGCRFANDFCDFCMWTINLLTGDVIEKCLSSTFMQVVLSVGEIWLGKNLQDLIEKRPFTGCCLC